MNSQELRRRSANGRLASTLLYGHVPKNRDEGF